MPLTPQGPQSISSAQASPLLSIKCIAKYPQKKGKTVHFCFHMHSWANKVCSEMCSGLTELAWHKIHKNRLTTGTIFTVMLRNCTFCDWEQEYYKIANELNQRVDYLFHLYFKFFSSPFPQGQRATNTNHYSWLMLWVYVSGWTLSTPTRWLPVPPCEAKISFFR